MGPFLALDFPRHHSDQEPTSLEQEETEKGVASWATSFEKLLEDPAGLHTFAEFLKKEFSHENIYFWVACERYRELKDEPERKRAAKEIFERHLCLGALEPVNVDSHARQVTQDGLEQAPETLFIQAQKQIFDLMKFDSYPRFIKSDLYKECLLRQLSGQELPYTGGEDLDSGLQLKPKTENGGSPNGSRTKLKKSRSDAEDRRRKSLLPWHRKNRSKSKDRGESEYNKMRMINQQQDTEDAVSVRSDVTSSRSSLASWDLALRGSFSRQSVTSGELGEREPCTLCRVILADGATTVVQTRKHENVKDMVKRLLDKRGLHYSSFEVYVGNSTKPVSLDEESSVLGGKEVQVEQRVSFRLDLPNRKTVGVKAKSSKSLGEVLRPILHKYGYNVELVTLCLMSENEVLELNLPVLAVDNQRLQVLTRSADAWKNDAAHKTKSGPTLDEITNRVFEELLQGKAEGRTTPDQGSVRSEDWGSEHSSGIFGRFLRRDSGLLEKSRETRGKSKKGSVNKQEDSESKPAAITRAPLIAKWKVGVKLQSRSESDELYEGLKRAQRSRLEDQRGTEINFELPDFLKDKENAPQAGKKLRKFRRSEELGQTKFYDSTEVQQPQAVGGSHESLVLQQNAKSSLNVDKDANTSLVPHFLDNSFSTGSVVPSHRQAEEYFLGRSAGIMEFSGCKLSARSEKIAANGINKSSETMNRNSSPDNTLVEADLGDVTLTCDSTDENSNSAPVTTRSRQLSDPPPLPPKPKHLPSKASLWGASSIPPFRTSTDAPNPCTRLVRPNDVKRDVKICRIRRSVYLDQPSSSFV